MSHHLSLITSTTKKPPKREEYIVSFLFSTPLKTWSGVFIFLLYFYVTEFITTNTQSVRHSSSSYLWYSPTDSTPQRKWTTLGHSLSSQYRSISYNKCPHRSSFYTCCLRYPCIQRATKLCKGFCSPYCVWTLEGWAYFYANPKGCGRAFSEVFCGHGFLYTRSVSNGPVLYYRTRRIQWFCSFSMEKTSI